MGDLDFLSLVQDTSSLDPVMYEYFNQRFNHRTVVFNKDVTEDIVETIWLPLRNFEMDDSNTPVTLIINSMGGSVTDGFFLAHYLANYSKPLYVYITGCAASMAAVILAGCGKNPNITRFCYPSSYALIHDGYVALAASEAKTAQDMMTFNNKVDEDIRKFIIDHTNITAEQYDEHARHQWFIDAREMLELGLCDKIIGDDD